MTALVEYGLLLAGLAIGASIGWLLAKQSLSGQLIRAEERLRASEASAEGNEQRIRAEVENIAIKIGEENSTRFLEMAQAKLVNQQQEAAHELELRKLEVANLVKPIQEEMAKLTVMNAEMEKERAGAYEGIKRHLRELGEKTESLSTRTTALSTALTTSSQARGNWGEVKLRRLFEMAGMSENIDFDEQTTLADGSRPDFVVRLPDRGVIPIDSKATGAHFLQAAELDPSEEQTVLLKKHAKAMRGRIAELSKKAYQETIEGEFDHVVMFIPSEAMAAAAFSSLRGSEAFNPMLQPPTHVVSKHKSLCLVDGCENSRKVPSSNNRLPLTCPAHAGARAVPYLGALSRECQACRTFHELAAFDRDNKTCEIRLLRKKLRYRARTLGATASSWTRRSG